MKILDSIGGEDTRFARLFASAHYERALAGLLYPMSWNENNLFANHAILSTFRPSVDCIQRILLPKNHALILCKNIVARYILLTGACSTRKFQLKSIIVQYNFNFLKSHYTVIRSVSIVTMKARWSAFNTAP